MLAETTRPGDGAKEPISHGYRPIDMTWRMWLCMAVASVLTIACGASDDRPQDAPPGSQDDKLLYHCYPGFPFDPFSFEAGNEEEGNEASSQALARLLRSDEAAMLPRTGWTQVGRNGNQIGFVARDERGNFYDARVKKEDGRWAFAGLGECRPGPELAVRDASVVEWVLNPDEPPPEAGDRTIDALVNELSCHGFSDPLKRMNEPRVLHHGQKTYIVLTADPLGGFQTCPGTPWVEFEIQLDEPLSQAELYDAGIYPPRPAGRDVSP